MTNLLTLKPGALSDYQVWINTIKQRIVSVRMALAASRELILFYTGVCQVFPPQTVHPSHLVNSLLTKCKMWKTAIATVGQ